MPDINTSKLPIVSGFSHGRFSDWSISAYGVPSRMVVYSGTRREDGKLSNRVEHFGVGVERMMWRADGGKGEGF